MSENLILSARRMSQLDDSRRGLDTKGGGRGSSLIYEIVIRCGTGLFRRSGHASALPASDVSLVLQDGSQLIHHWILTAAITRHLGSF